MAAHPDDVEFRCGGTLAKWAAAGTEVHHLVLTDGSKGTWDPDHDVAALVALREDEQRTAAAELGATGEVVFLGIVDGELDSDLATRREVTRWIRRLRPDVVLGHDPWRRYRLHPDHRHAGWLTVDAVVAARDPHFLLCSRTWGWPTTGRRRCSSSRPTSPITRRTCRVTATGRSRRSSPTAASTARPWTSTTPGTRPSGGRSPSGSPRSSLATARGRGSSTPSCSAPSAPWSSGHRSLSGSYDAFVVDATETDGPTDPVWLEPHHRGGRAQGRGGHGAGVRPRSLDHRPPRPAGDARRHRWRAHRVDRGLIES
ncbi:MAG: PIG-L family deacetylase [Acidimicrobiia bacterium]|nr:PIG-L family deacetylase [Acidimicrobiia bacterium]